MSAPKGDLYDGAAVPIGVHRKTERQPDLFTHDSQRLIDTFRCIVTGFVQSLCIIKIQIILY